MIEAETAPIKGAFKDQYIARSMLAALARSLCFSSCSGAERGSGERPCDHSRRDKGSEKITRPRNHFVFRTGALPGNRRLRQGIRLRKKSMVDYGTHVKTGQVMAVLEIPELEAQLQEDQAEIKNAVNQVSRAQHELSRYQAQYNALHLEYTRLNGVFQSQPGIVAQQEVDDAQGKDLAASSQVDAGQAALEAAQSQLAVAKAKLVHDQSLFDYSKITAPFPGVVTERYANLGTLVQAGTGSSTQAMPIVRLSEDDLFRLVIPVPESYVDTSALAIAWMFMFRRLTGLFPERWRGFRWM